MAGRRIDVFFYGLFMDTELLRSKGVSPQNIRRAGALGYELRIGKRATLWREPKACAYGFLVELDDGSSIPALTFNLVESPHTNERNSEYAAKLRELARRLDLPTGYVNA